MIFNKVKKINNRSKINIQSGFTLVEALFAVTVLTFTITILMTVVSKSLFSVRYSKDEITVNYLLQEVIDHVRNDRDTFVFLHNGSWDDFYGRYDRCSTSSGGCYFNITDNNLPDNIKSCGDNCPTMYYDSSASYGSYYNYYPISYNGEDNDLSNFKRKIIIEKNPTDNNEIIINVTVSWMNGNSNIERSLSNSITNWR